jgi:hypothetical protein
MQPESWRPKLGFAARNTTQLFVRFAVSNSYKSATGKFRVQRNSRSACSCCTIEPAVPDTSKKYRFAQLNQVAAQTDDVRYQTLFSDSSAPVARPASRFDGMRKSGASEGERSACTNVHARDAMTGTPAPAVRYRSIQRSAP